MTEYKDPLVDPVFRTISNLEIIERCYDCESKMGLPDESRTAFEVTAILNSFLSLLAHPWERLFDQDRLSRIDLSSNEYRTLGWPPVRPVLEGNTFRINSLKQLLRFLRNGIAHGNVEFCTEKQLVRDYGVFVENQDFRNRMESSKEIAGVIIWNIAPGAYDLVGEKPIQSVRYEYRDLAIALTVSEMKEITTALQKMSESPRFHARRTERLRANKSLSKTQSEQLIRARLERSGPSQ